MDKSALASRMALPLAIAISIFAAETVDVKIIDRQNHDKIYTYVVPGYSTSNTNTDVNCYGNVSNINCSGTTRTTHMSTPSVSASYEVSGATFSLQLPDGRVAVVNCDSKYPPRGIAVALAVAGATNVNRRSCRIPLLNDVQAEFSGDRAKLKWTVSIDGKKVESETYKIMAVLDKR